jgi:hypothetical protein
MKLPRLSVLGKAPALLAALALGLSAMPAVPALAQTEAPQSDPGVARLSDLAGSVNVRRSDSEDAFAAALNAPLGVGDYITTQDGARAEIEFNYDSLVRVAPGTQIRFVKLDPHAHELQLAEGTVELRIFRGLEAHPVVDTPAASIVPDQEGRYRITVTHDGDTEITVRSGKADVQIGDDNTPHVAAPGTTMLVRGQGRDLRVSSIVTVAQSDFDNYADARDQHVAPAGEAATYADQGMVGANDLNQYGQWTQSADYGQVWQPTGQPAGWAPYTDGRWVWEPYYGWTWIGNEAWGYAPYHYGRWFYENSAWFWAPGAPVDAGYSYAPAEVGFFGYGDGDGGGDTGGGGGININLNFGGFPNIGWSPLAPFEALSAWWGGGNALGIFGAFGGIATAFGSLFGGGSNGGNYNGGYGYGYHGGGFPYRNGSAPGGAVGVSGGNFGTGHFEHIQPVGANLLHGVTAVKGALPVLPTAANLAFGGAASRVLGSVSPLSSHFNQLQPVRNVTRPFEQERSTVAALVRSQVERGASERGTSGTAGFENAATGSGSQTGSAWDRFGSPSRAVDAPRSEENTFDRTGAEGARSSESARPGDAWKRFGPGEGERQSSGANYRSTVPSYAQRAESQYAHSYSEPSHSYSGYSHSYSEPARSYSNDSRSYSEPARSYSAPSRSYSAPSRSYSAPSRSYSAPSRSYSAPSRSYSAPSHSSHGGGSGGGHSSKHR